MLLLTVFLLSCCGVLTTCFAADPVPPTAWPAQWHTWVVTSVVKVGSRPTYTVGQLIAYDSVNQWTCRYLQQNLLIPTATRPVDTCDYTAKQHFVLSDILSNATCLGTTPVQGTVTPLVYPPEYLSVAKFLGVDRVAQKLCNHFVATGIVIDNENLQMDVWTTTDTSLPCQISVTNLGVQEITNWAFDGFNNIIPDTAVKQCGAPKLVCQNNEVCRVNPSATTGQLQSAIEWVCNPTLLDCSPIQPGGSNYIPNTLVDHCNWAFNSYYIKNRPSQGQQACNFGGAARLVASGNSIATPVKLTNSVPFSVFNLDIVCEKASP